MNEKIKRKTISHDFEPKSEYMSVRFNDDSMRNAGIFKDSVLVLHKQRTANDGDIVAVLFENNLYLRRLKSFGKTIMLMPESSVYEPIVVVDKEEILILGKVVQISSFLD